MAVTAKFIADFSSFNDAVSKAEVKLSEFTKGASKVEGSLKRMADSFSGKRVIQDATLMAKAIEETGGVAKLTGSQLQRAGAIASEALAVMKARGLEVPPALRKIADEAERASKSTTGLSAKMVAFGAAVGTFVGNVLYDGVRRVASALLDIASNGIKLAPTVGAFNALTRAVGESGDAMLRAARTGTKGLISDLELMQAANKGLLLGLPITAQSFGMLSQTAVVLGKSMGQGPVKSFDDLITALGRSSPMILDNLGLSVKVGEANDKYAKSVGKTADSLSDAEKKLAFYNAAMEAAKRKVEEVGGLNLTLADRVQQAQVAFKNFTDALGVAVATSPVVNAAFGGISDAISKAFGENQTVLVQRLIGVVNKVAIGVVDVAQVGITSASVIHRAWAGIEALFLGLASVVGIVGLAFGKLVEGAAAVASYVPGLGGAMSGLKATMHEFNEVTRASQRTLHDQASSAWEAAKGNGSFEQALDGASASLTSMRGKMVAASRVGVDATKIADQLSKSHDGVAKSTRVVSKEMADFAGYIRGIEQAARPAADVIAELDGTVLEGVRYYTEKGIAIEKLARMYGLTEAQVSALKEADDDESAALRRQVGHMQEAASALAKLTNVRRESVSVLEEARPRQTIDVATLIAQNRAKVPSLMALLKGDVRDFFDNGTFSQTVIQGLTGGGGLKGGVEAAASSIGAKFTDTLGASLSKGLGGTLGKTLGSLIGPIGAFAGPLLSKAVSAIGKLFGNNAEKKINPIRQQFVDAAGGLGELDKRAAAAGVTLRAMLDAKNPEQYKKAIDELNASLQFQDAAMATLDETVKKYGFSLEELGPTLQRQGLDKQAQALFQDFKVLTSAGIGTDTVIGRMGDSINEFVHDALKTGTEIPAAMAPMIQRMVEMGILTDENGNVIGDLESAGVRFAETMTQGFANVVQAVQKLTEAIARGLGLAIENIPDPQVEGHVTWKVDPVPGDYTKYQQDWLPNTQAPIPMAAGGDFMVRRPTLFLAGESGPERATFTPAGKDRPGDAATTPAMPTAIHVHIGDREIGAIALDDILRGGKSLGKFRALVRAVA